jgi:anthranilate synthase/aminodeoxychorismate synthase-like glutamine amidotransferase
LLVFIDNYDSFTYNLVQYFGEQGAEMLVFRNDAIDAAGVSALQPAGLVVSPGPCTPTQAGNSCAIIQAMAERAPILGVCLGHQCIGQVFGGTVSHAPTIMHGKFSQVHHDGEGLFEGVPSPFKVTRYHSLAVQPDDFPECLRITARSEDGVIMSLQHRQLPVYGVQFHPESIFTEHGKQIIENFLRICASPD